MREYGQIQSAFWQAPDILGLSDQAKLLATFLLTGPSTNGIGCFSMGNGAIADHLGWASDFAEARFAELSANGFAYRFGTVVFVPNFLRWNRIANGNVAKARFQEWEQVPRGSCKGFAARAMLSFSDFWSDDHRAILETVAETVSGTVITPVENQNPTQTQPKPTQTQPNPSIGESSSPPKKSARVNRTKAANVPEGFDLFWSIYPRKDAKANALKSYGKTTEAERRVIATVILQFAASWKWQNEPEYIPHAATWLNQRRWEDDPPPKEPPRQQQAAPKQSRQAAIAETLLRDSRYAHTAARQSGLALSHGDRRASDADAVVATVSARLRHDSGDGDGLD